MARARAVVGLLAGLLMLLSAAAHSLLGGRALSADLEQAHVPAELMRGVMVGWHFGGAAMLAFGVIVTTLFAARLRGRAGAGLPAAVIACAYLGFGAWALAITDFNPFFLVFVVPGVLLALALYGPAGASSNPNG